MQTVRRSSMSAITKRWWQFSLKTLLAVALILPVLAWLNLRTQIVVPKLPDQEPDELYFYSVTVFRGWPTHHCRVHYLLDYDGAQKFAHVTPDELRRVPTPGGNRSDCLAINIVVAVLILGSTISVTEFLARRRRLSTA